MKSMLYAATAGLAMAAPKWDELTTDYSYEVRGLQGHDQPMRPLNARACAQRPTFASARFNLQQWVNDFTPRFPGTKDAFQSNLAKVMTQ